LTRNNPDVSLYRKKLLCFQTSFTDKHKTYNAYFLLSGIADRESGILLTRIWEDGAKTTGNLGRMPAAASVDVMIKGLREGW
jgi:hypothetical protein